MNTAEATPISNAAQQVLAAAVANRIESMSKEELQSLMANGQLELQKENAALRQRIEQLEQTCSAHKQQIEKLEADKIRLYYRIAHLEFNEKDWENFDPSEYTVSAEEMLQAVNKIKE